MNHDQYAFVAGGFRLFSTQVATEPSTADGLTVEGIVASQWTILDESDSDWKSHAAAIAQSIQVIKRRLQVYLVFMYSCILIYVYL